MAGLNSVPRGDGRFVDMFGRRPTRDLSDTAFGRYGGSLPPPQVTPVSSPVPPMIEPRRRLARPARSTIAGGSTESGGY